MRLIKRTSENVIEKRQEAVFSNAPKTNVLVDFTNPTQSARKKYIQIKFLRISFMSNFQHSQTLKK